MLRDATFSLAAGEIVALVGRNGAGKSTLLRILTALVRPTGGRVAWAATGSALPPPDAAYFAGAPTLPPRVRASRWARLVSGVDSVTEERRPIRQLSRGSRQLLGLRTVLQRRRLSALLLDEPWEGLDPDGARWLSARLQERRAAGCAILVSSHRLHDLAGVCDRYAFLRDGGLAVRTAGGLSATAVTAGDLLRELDRISTAELRTENRELRTEN